MNDDTENEVIIYYTGVIHISVCAPVGLPIEAVCDEANRQHPTGISSRWGRSERHAFVGGEPNPCPCQDDARRQHWLLAC